MFMLLIYDKICKIKIVIKFKEKIKKKQNNKNKYIFLNNKIMVKA